MDPTEASTSDDIQNDEDKTSINQNIIYEQDGVFIHFNAPSVDDDDIMLGGTLKIIEKGNQHILQWKSYNTDIGQVSQEVESQCITKSSNAIEKKDQMQFNVPAQEISSEMRVPPETNEDLNATSEPEWTLVALSKNPDTSANMITEVPQDLSALNEQTSYDFTIPLEDLAVIKKSKKGVGWKYLVLELDDRASLPPLHFHQGGSKKFVKALKLHCMLTPSTENPHLIHITSRHEAALSRSISELNVFAEESFPTILQNPVASAWIGFSRVTNFLQDVLNPQEVTPETRPASERASVLDEDDSRLSPLGQSGDSGGGFELIASANLAPRIDPPRELPMTEEVWNSYKNEDGRIVDVNKVKTAIFRGGLQPELRKEAWKYLLKYYKWNMTEKETRDHQRKMEEDYYRIKMQWKSIDEDQENRFTALKDRKSLIEKDVNRTDRKRRFYEGNENISLKLLNDILVTYVMYNFDLGYVQGMSDLLSPILEVMKSEVDAFWCFVGFMNIVERNFEKNQCGMKEQLRDLRTLLQFLDSQLFDNLTEKDSNNLYFCFRWLLLRFKREFSFEDIQSLWEVMWTELPCSNYHLLMCVAILDTERQTLLLEECGFTDILKHINELSNKINVEATLSKTEGMYNQLKASKDVPDAVREVLGLPAS